MCLLSYREIFELMKKLHQNVFENHPIAFDSDKKAYSVGIIPDVANCKGHSATYEVSLSSNMKIPKLSSKVQ